MFSGEFISFQRETVARKTSQIFRRILSRFQANSSHGQGNQRF